MLFVSEKRAKVAAENPDMKVTELAKVFGEMWAALGDAGKENYNSKAKVRSTAPW
jgi:hypothetical protein